MNLRTANLSGDWQMVQKRIRLDALAQNVVHPNDKQMYNIKRKIIKFGREKRRFGSCKDKASIKRLTPLH